MPLPRDGILTSAEAEVPLERTSRFAPAERRLAGGALLDVPKVPEADPASPASCPPTTESDSLTGLELTWADSWPGFKPMEGAHSDGTEQPPMDSLQRLNSAPAILEFRQHRAKADRAIGKVRSFESWQDARPWFSYKQPRAKDCDERTLIRNAVTAHYASACLSEKDIDLLVDGVEYYSFQAGLRLARGHYCLVVRTGLMDVIAEDGTVLRSVGRGVCFGGSALMGFVQENTSIIAKEDSGVWGVDASTFQAEWKKRACGDLSLLDACDFLKGLSALQKSRLASALSTEFHKAGARIVTEGEEVTRMRIVKEGRLSILGGGAVDATTGILEGATRLAEVDVGQTFGKSAAMRSVTMSKVSVVADSDCVLACVGSADLQALLGSDPKGEIWASFIIRSLAGSSFLSQFTETQQRHIVKAMNIEDCEPECEVDDEMFGWWIVLTGEVYSGDRGNEVVLGRGYLFEATDFAPSEDEIIPKRRSKRIATGDGTASIDSISRNSRETSSSAAAVTSAAASSPARGLLRTGPRGARLATLSREGLVEALQAMGISASSQDTIDHARKLLLAKKVPLLYHLTSEQVEEISESFMMLVLKQGQRLFEEGQQANDFWIISKGEVEELDEKGRYLRTHCQNGIVGIRSLLCKAMQTRDEPRRTTARVCSETAELWQLEGEMLDEILTDSRREEMWSYFLLRDTAVELQDLRHLRIIGRGSFGSVRLVEHRSAALRYALKRVKKRQDGESLEAVVRNECALLAELTHPMVLQLVKTFETASSIYILSEYLAGSDMFDALNAIGRPLRKDEAQFYAASLLMVLEYLSERHVVFRDLKPENVMLDAAGYIKLIDFGTAKRLEEQGQTFTMVGSCHFMAPEITRCQGYGTEVDIWSLGIMLFEFVCGSLPFGKDLVNPTQLQVCRAVQTENLVFPKWYSDTSGKHLIRGLLRKEAERRMGCGGDGIQEIKGHDFFRLKGPTNLFSSILQREIVPPYLPDRSESKESPGLAESISDADDFA